MEVHIDDIHGCGKALDVEIFVEQMKQLVQLKFGGMQKEGESYCHLKRPRTPVSNGCWVGGNRKYVRDLLHKLGMEDCKPAATPSTMTGGGEDDTMLDLNLVKTYRSAVGSLLYMASDREDIQWEVSKLARRLKEPRVCDLKLLKRVARYLQGTQEMETFLPRPPGSKT
eukprot:3677241-Amphidinium_carterae.1